MATRGDAAQAVQEAARLGVSTVIEGILAGAIEVGAAAPVIAPVCVTLQGVKSIVDRAKCNKEELEDLHARCQLIVEMVIDKAKASKTSTIDVSPLEQIVDQLELVAERFARQSRFAKMFGQYRKNSDDIQKLRVNIEAVVQIMALSFGVENAKRLDFITGSNIRSLNHTTMIGDKSKPLPFETASFSLGYEGQNKRALVCHLGLPGNCELANQPVDVLTDFVVLFSFSLAQAYWCEILLCDRFAELVKAPWIFGVILGTPLLIPALGPVGEGLENWSKDNLGYNLDFSASRMPLCIIGLLVAVVIVAWHFARAFWTLPGLTLISGGVKVDPPLEDLFGIYTSSRIVVITWCILFTSFLILGDDGWGNRGALLAWMLSLIAVFPHPVSYAWLGINTGIFIQGISTHRLRFLGFATVTQFLSTCPVP
eukprot:g13826.t1